MFAWLIEQHGGLNELKFIEQDVPTPSPEEALIRVRALGLNHLDLWVRRGVPGHRFPLPMVPGCDVVGEIVSFGELSDHCADVLEKRGLSLKSRVIVNPLISCRKCKACLAGNEPVCRKFSLIGETQDGGAREFMCVPVENLFFLPDTISDEKASALAVSAVTAWSMVHTKGKFQKGESALVMAGSSGVSTYAIQMLKNIGASEIFTTTSSESKVESLKSIGATKVVCLKKDDLKEVVRAGLPSEKRGVDLVIEHLGDGMFEKSLRLLDWGGRLVSCGATTGQEVKLNLNALFFKNLSVIGNTMGSEEDFKSVLNAAISGEITPCIHKVFSFKEYDKAQMELESPERFGKVVISMEL